MKKYRLKKDLPFAKTGHIFRDYDGRLISLGVSHLEIPKECFYNFNEWFEVEGILKPENGDYYYFIDLDSRVERSSWANDKTDNWRLKSNSVFKTKEQAEKRKRQIEAEHILRQDAKGFVPDWSDRKQEKWYVYYNYSRMNFDITNCQNNRATNTGIYFAELEDAQSSLENHYKKWLEYFGVEDEE